MIFRLGPDMVYIDIVRALRRYGGKRRRVVALRTIARSIGHSSADTLFYLRQMEDRGLVEIVTDAGYAARLRRAEE